MNEIRKLLARAISGAPFPSKHSFAKADAVIAALDAVGWGIKPRAPTEAMLGGDEFGDVNYRRQSWLDMFDKAPGRPE